MCVCVCLCAKQRNWAILKLSTMALRIHEERRNYFKELKAKYMLDIKNADVVLQTTAQMAHNLEYTKQGNIDLYSEENLVRRHNLRKHKRIDWVITRFWLMLIGEQSTNMFRARIRARQYTNLLVKLEKALVPNFHLEDATANALKDWQHDSGGEETMTYGQFFDGLFELADNWVNEIDADKYADFLDVLFLNVTRADLQAWRRWGGGLVATARS